MTGHRQEVVHVHQRDPRRLARAGDHQRPLQLPGDLRERGRPRAREGGRPESPRRLIFHEVVFGISGHDAAASTRSTLQPTHDVGQGRVGGAGPDPRSRSTTAPGTAEPAIPTPGFEPRLRLLPGPRDHGRSWYLGDDGTLDRLPGRRRRRRRLHLRTARTAPRPTSRATPAPAGSGARLPPTSGTRTRRAPRSPTRPIRWRPTRRCSAPAPSTSGFAPRSPTSTSR